MCLKGLSGSEPCPARLGAVQGSGAGQAEVEGRMTALDGHRKSSALGWDGRSTQLASELSVAGAKPLPQR